MLKCHGCDSLSRPNIDTTAATLFFFLHHKMTSVFIALVAIATTLVQGHVVVTYPGWRGNNLIVNETFPFGMQWIYPCGGTSPTNNRTNWPLDGSGAVAFEPGWFAGHDRNLMYINLCLGAQPVNCSFPMVPVFEITGPNDRPYPGGVCLPKVPLPNGVQPKDGDLATIQIIQTQKHGASLYSVSYLYLTTHTHTHTHKY